ncbi:hypothetical protein CANINC_001785 [Pichia inconspicua]|uniref:SUN domain-containing protein n=1 Tax=Pichia inconspicua TaxID=52247 RepID=A0A4T0X2X9_9ASCO|nr:hypothetical protein CANINC_001785 [[Candida] inconspicua]
MILPSKESYSSEMGNASERLVPIDGKGEHFKEFVQELYEVEKDDERESQIFTKETFVLSEKDLAIVNREVQQRLNQELEVEYYQDEEEDDDDDYEDIDDDEGKITDSYYQGEQSFYGDNDDELTSYKGPKRAISTESVDSDADYDSTQYIYDPPNKYKDRFLLYLLKASPILVVLFALYLYIGPIASSEIATIFNSSIPSPYLNHKIFVLEEEISSLRKLKHLDKKVDSIQSEIRLMKEYLETLQLNPKLAANGDRVATRLEAIEASIRKLSEKVESSDVSAAATAATTTTTTTTVTVTSTAIRLPRESSSKVEGRYYNVASHCSVVRRLTSIPWRARRRKSAIERILFGFPDFFKRVLQKREKSNAVRSIGGVSLLSAANHPRNVLQDSLNKFWQIQATNLPVYYTVRLPDAGKIYEIGLYHSRQCPIVSTELSIQTEIRNRWMKTAPQDVEVLLRPVVGDVKMMRDAMAKFYNQDLKFDGPFASNKRSSELDGWIRAGTMRYDIEVDNGYQAFPWSAEVRGEISRFRVLEVMIVIHSNWGDEVIVLDSLRIFEHAEDEKMGVVDDYDDDDVYLGQEK